MSQLSLYEAQTIGAPHNGTETSVLAAKAAAPKVSPQKRAILRHIAIHASLAAAFDIPPGMTQDEIAFDMDLPRSTVCARMNELEREGYIKKTGKTRPTRYGRAASVYVLTGASDGPRPRDELGH